MCFREEKCDDDDVDDTKQENMVEDSNKATATMVTSTDDMVDEVTMDNSLLHETVTSNGDTQDVVKAPPAILDIRKTRTSSSSSELMSPMHDHTYALPPLLITPTMMATIDSHSLSYKGYTCLSKVGVISAAPQLPAENSSLKKSVELLKEAHTHLGT